MEYYLWFAAALIFFILEIIIPGFVLLWFGVGAGVAGVLDLLGVQSVGVQILVFVLVSFVLVALSRTIFKNIFMRKSPGAGLKTNMDAMIGKVGTVTVRIDGDRSVGRVLVEGQDWAAHAEDNGTIEEKTSIIVKGFEGARLIVKEV
jgi:membrane protein implicated in regulation of membrane protease activity